MVVVSSGISKKLFSYIKYIVSGLLNREISTNCEVMIRLLLNLSYK